MFGDDHSDAQQMANQSGFGEPASDGTLGAPAADTGTMPGTAAPQNDMTDQLMPGSGTQQQPAADTGTSLPRPAMPAGTAGDDDLIGIKQEALQQLRPLVGHLDQSAEERFRTTMMMIQAADDQSLIPEAYAAAKEIADDKARAQALLDVINEINYFTAHQDQDQS